MLTIQQLEYFYSIGLHAVPVHFNLETKQVDSYPAHETAATGPGGRPSLQDAKKWFKAVQANGVGVKVYPPFGMIDFDIKNSSDKRIFDKWLLACKSVDDGWLSKVCIERTRSNGYHVYIKYEGMDHKIPLAKENRQETISLYTGTLLSFCSPSPGYEFTHNEWADLDFLTNEEFELLTTVAGTFNKDRQTYDYSTEQKEGGLQYPKAREHLFSKFDRLLSEEHFETLLNSISLFRNPDSKPTKSGAIKYSRPGTLAPYSAKVFYYDRYTSWSGWRLVIFSASLQSFPCYHDKLGKKDPTWILTPGRLLYYKNGRDWTLAQAELEMIVDSAGIEIPVAPDFSAEDNVPIHQIEADRPAILPGTFPFDVFPAALHRNFSEIASHYSIPLDYLGTTALFAIAGLSGNMYQTELGKRIKCIIYAMLVGPSGVGKSPAYNLLCGEVVSSAEKQLHDDFLKQKREWKALEHTARSKKNGEAFTKPEPKRLVRTGNGGTAEGMMGKALSSPAGIALYYDEGGRMFGSPNAYKTGKDNSSTDFWNEMWNGQPSNEFRADEDRERFVPATSISSLIGMQTDRVSRYFDKDSIESGLSSRFLVTQSDYIQLNDRVDHFAQAQHACPEWVELLTYLFDQGAYHYTRESKPRTVYFSGASSQLYNDLSRKLVQEANQKRADRLAGDVTQLMVAYDAKLYSYVGRFILILAILDDPRDPVITPKHVENAEKLYRFYRAQAINLFTVLNREMQQEMTANQAELLKALPDTFTTKEAKEICKKLKLSDQFFDSTFFRIYDKKRLIKKIKRGEYEKI
jgi:Protein of unknown function (DUF3987)